ncbi:MAG: SDR family oxidoreductase [Azonexus sp.]|jgi:NAD(P)-dependent dehydrogenase (short-subunit alcohol dehydrogenase family)|nr:SDR family oxidoreductase [Azonexus sp.]
MNLLGRVALVTGGGRGIGAGITRCLARDGADIAIIYRRDRVAAEATAASVRALGRRVELIQADIRDPAQCQRAVDETLTVFGYVDIFVHNAGTGSKGLSAVDTSLEEYDDALRIHCLGAVWLVRALVPQMRLRSRGDVILVTSSIRSGGSPGIAPYAIGKAAAEAFAQSLAHEERRHNIRVNVIRPGFTDTEMGRRLSRAVSGSADMRQWDAHAPFGRVEQPEDIGNAIAFLVSEGGAYITNQILCVDGGQATVGGAVDVMGSVLRSQDQS